LLLSLLLRRRGYNVIYLGANVPADRFAETALKVKTNLVILVAQTLNSAAHLQQTALALTAQNVNTAFGGRIFNLRESMIDHIPGHYLGKSLELSIQQVDEILKGKKPAREIKTASQKYMTALHAFVAKRSRIESTIKEHIQPLMVSPENLSTGIHFLGNNIAAALQLGNLDHLSEEMEWLKSLLQMHESQPQELHHFMEVYSDAVEEHINGQGEPIKTWLHSFVSENK
jgi:cobalamin-dependent methionine synthase I